MSMLPARGRIRAEPNLTPLIDVLLVLLVIFMVMPSLRREAISVQVPAPDTPSTGQSETDLVLEIGPGGTYHLNRQPVPAHALEATVRAVFAPRPRKVLQVMGAETASYGEVIRAVDATRAAGVEVVGLVPRRG